MSVILIRAIVLYAFVIFAVRLMGKRQIGELQPSELVITILVSNIATLPIEDTSIPMVMGLLPIIVLVCLDVVMSGATLKFRKLRGIISGNPKIIIKDGNIDQKQMRTLRFTIDDLMEALHEYSIFDIAEVQFAIVETTGKISVYQKYASRGVTNDDIGISGKSENPPTIVINDGVLIEDGLTAVKRGKGWLEKVLSDKKLKRGDVFLMTVDDSGKYNIIERESVK